MFTAVTVAFAREKPMLKLQARSLDRFVDWIDEIILIDNEPGGSKLEDAIIWYGRHADKVSVISAKDVIGDPGPNPYYDQMTAKIKSHGFCHNNDIVVLDAKSWFIESVTQEHILSNGRYLAEYYELTEPWDRTWRNSLSLFDLDQEKFGSLLMSCRTPFFVNRNTLQELDQRLNIKDLISTRRRFSEFCLINALIIASYGSLDSYFRYEQNGYCNGVWPNYGNDERITERLIGREFRNQHIFCTGMHRKVWATIDSSKRNSIISGWLELGLVNEDEGNRIFDEMVQLNPIIDRQSP